MSHVLDTVVSRFLTIYGEPRTDNAEALYSEYVRALKDFGVVALDLAVDEIVKMHTFPTWPTPGEVYKQAVIEASKLYAKQKPKIQEPDADGWVKPWVPTEEQKALNRAKVEALKRMSVKPFEWSDEPQIVPDRDFMEKVQMRALGTADGRLRHLRGWYSGLSNEPDEAKE